MTFPFLASFRLSFSSAVISSLGIINASCCNCVFPTLQKHTVTSRCQTLKILTKSLIVHVTYVSYANHMLLFAERQVLVCIEKSRRSVLRNISSQQKVHHGSLQWFLHVNPQSLWCFFFCFSLFISFFTSLKWVLLWLWRFSERFRGSLCVCVCELRYRHVQSNSHCSFMDNQRLDLPGFHNSWKTGMINEKRNQNIWIQSFLINFIIVIFKYA